MNCEHKKYTARYTGNIFECDDCGEVFIFEDKK